MKAFFKHRLAKRLADSPMDSRRQLVYLFAEAAAQRLALEETTCYTLSQLHYQLLKAFAASLKGSAQILSAYYWQIAQSLRHDHPVTLKAQQINDIMTAIYLNIL